MRPPWPVIGSLLLGTLLLGVGAPAHADETYVLRALARTGDAAPGGGTFDRFGQETLPILAPVNARGDIAFFASLSRGASDDGIFLRRAGRVVVVAREGDRVAGVGRLSGFAKHPTPALNDAGTVAFAAAVAGGRAVEGIFTWSGGRLRAVATTGTPAPGMPSSVLSGVDTPAINARGDVVFLATIRRGRESIETILASSGGVLRKVVAQGDPAPAGGVFAAFGPPAVNARGSVAFAAVAEGKAVPGGVFVATGDRIQMVVGAGEGTPIGGIFAKFSERIGLNDAGVIAFHGMLKFAPVEAAIFAVEDGRDGRVRVLEGARVVPLVVVVDHLHRVRPRGQHEALADLAPGEARPLHRDPGLLGQVGEGHDVLALGPRGSQSRRDDQQREWHRRQAPDVRTPAPPSGGRRRRMLHSRYPAPAI